ncbi:NAD kinase [Sphaerisporangium krabiense]|uniref:NAD kinase n=1 Tax=Sphaerisporangium krabiense TaxID=763782 RepID=A0A7W8ZBA1_9ACTN|nr:NAD(+)/NADH kinase [Sphaerisporangium krabiense]MBB5630839.1 NAD+ kinase [Sphaerisporangium krabiense]GII65478.1 NAD kinase [Sphaerisporangium krabiense]
MGMVTTVGLVLHPQRDSKEAIDVIVEWARTRKVTVLGLPDEVGRIDCSAEAVGPDALVERADLVVSLGGDGTMLRTMRLLAGRSTPVLGVNLGRLGFLAEIDVEELQPALSAIDNHEFTVEPRMAVRASLPDGRQVTAFNDIALVRIPGDRLAAVAISVEGDPFVRYSSDAVIVATSTGSTAYNFSAGGPIVSPRVEGFLVVPAAAHSTFNRALVLSADEHVALELLPSSGQLAVEVDGAVHGRLSSGDRVTVTAVRGAGHVVRLGTTTFYERARRKLRVTGSAEVD